MKNDKCRSLADAQTFQFSSQVWTESTFHLSFIIYHFSFQKTDIIAMLSDKLRLLIKKCQSLADAQTFQFSNQVWTESTLHLSFIIYHFSFQKAVT